MILKLKIGQSGRLKPAPSDSPKPELRRMQELGFVEGASVTLLRKGPFGSPLLFDVGHTRLSIRKEEAAWFQIE